VAGIAEPTDASHSIRAARIATPVDRLSRCAYSSASPVGSATRPLRTSANATVSPEVWPASPTRGAIRPTRLPRTPLPPFRSAIDGHHRPARHYSRYHPASEPNRAPGNPYTRPCRQHGRTREIPRCRPDTGKTRGLLVLPRVA